MRDLEAEGKTGGRSKVEYDLGSRRKRPACSRRYL